MWLGPAMLWLDAAILYLGAAMRWLDATVWASVSKKRRVIYIYPLSNRYITCSPNA